MCNMVEPLEEDPLDPQIDKAKILYFSCSYKTILSVIW